MYLPYQRHFGSRHRGRVHVWNRLALVVFAILVVALFEGCAAVADKPACPTMRVRVFEGSDGAMYLGFRTAELAEWADTIRRQARGECVVSPAAPKKGTET